MQGRRAIKVAVLLPTYNGVQFIEPQISSLKENETPFTLHWLDDHSTDGTREAVRACASKFMVDLIEWHQSEHQGWPATYYQLLECVEADIYLFCDQDDIWQPGKIDSTVSNLLPDLEAPTLCFSHALMFSGSEPRNVRRVFDTLGASIEEALQEEKIFTFNPAQGNTIGFTRPLREIFLSHKDIARLYGVCHDWWMYLIATASGTSRFLSDTPTTLYRIHANNACGMYPGVHVGWKSVTHATERWHFHHGYRRCISLQAEGFCLASETLPRAPTLERLLAIAQLVSTLGKRQSPRILVRLARLGAMPPSIVWGGWLAAACLTCDAKPSIERARIPSNGGG